jgi:hypothetical protein
MYQDLPFADRRQRRDARVSRHHRRFVLTGEKEAFDPASPTTVTADRRAGRSFGSSPAPPATERTLNWLPRRRSTRPGLDGPVDRKRPAAALLQKHPFGHWLRHECRLRPPSTKSAAGS